MRRIFVLLLTATALLFTPAMAYANHDYDDGYGDHYGNGNSGECQSGGCENRSSRCEGSTGDCRSSFSPGPFKDSPVTIGPVCMPGSTCEFHGPEEKKGEGGKQEPSH